MERVVLALVILSAAVCLVNSQSNECPDDIFTNRKHFRQYYVEAVSDDLVPDTCIFLWTRFNQVFTVNIVSCKPGFRAEIVPRISTDKYVCLPDLADGVLVPEPFVLGVPDSGAEARPSQQPTETPSQQPTETPTQGDVPRCPSDTSSYRRARYVVTSRNNLIEQRRCFIVTSVHGNTSRREQTIWDCKPGFTRTAVRQQYQCL